MKMSKSWPRGFTLIVQGKSAVPPSAHPAETRTSCVFTLLELLVVVAVISILMAILLPALQKTKATVNKIACLNNLKQIGVAVCMYVGDSNSQYPNSDDGISDYWKYQLAPNLGMQQSFGNPAFSTISE